MLNSYSEKRQVYSNTLVNTVINTPTQTDFAIGFGLGGKFVTKNGIMFEINAGIGKNLFGNYSNNNFGVEYVGRLGLWVGKRY